MNLKNTQLFEQYAPVVLVTGAARRIGAAIVQQLHQAGYRVVIHCHQSLDLAQVVAAELNQCRNHSAWVIQADLRLPAEVDGMIDAVINWGGSLFGLVNNASVFMRTDFQDIDLATFQELLQVNVLAPWQLSLNARPWLEKTQGNIINITDIHAEKPLKEYAEYCQSKAALWMQTKALAREFAPLIRVNAVAPGAIAWPEGENALSETVKTTLLAETPLKRHGDPCFIAEAVLALMRNEFMTGQVMRVDGGRSLG